MAMALSLGLTWADRRAISAAIRHDHEPRHRRDLAFPFLILALALVALFKPCLVTAMTAIGIAATPIFLRVTGGR